MATYRRFFQENGLVFITMVTQNRKPLLIKNIGILRKAFRHVKNYNTFEIIAICVLPDHVHMIIKPESIKEYPKINSGIKYYFSKNMPKCNEANERQILKREKGFWQRRYWEHTIRDEEDLNKHIDYIHFNPVKHELVEQVTDWQFSSFHKFLKDDYYIDEFKPIKNVEQIKELDFE